jgi:CRISPR-associated protein Cmr6
MMNRTSGRGGPASSNELHYLLPHDSARVVAGQISECRHLGLILSRYVPDEAINGAEQSKNVKWKDLWLKERLGQFANDRASEALSEAYYTRWERLTADSLRFTAQAQGRVVVGLGGKGVLETGLTLHHSSGLPTIPGSALKGLCRAYVLYTIAAHYAKDLQAIYQEVYQKEDFLTTLDKHLAQEKDSDKDVPKEIYDLEGVNDFRLAFGDTTQAGHCIFYEGLVQPPIPEYLFELDVMTPHFPDYYKNEGKKPPSDDQNPVPISFVTVAAGTHFAFAVGLRRGSDQSEKLVEWALGHLQKGLSELGIGAKTAAGYGVFGHFDPSYIKKSQ